MNTILTPKSSLEHVLKQKTQPLKFTFYDSNWEKIFFYLMLISFGILFVIGIANRFFDVTHLAIREIAIIFVLVMVISLFAYQLSMVWAVSKMIKYSEKSISDPRVNDFDSDIELIYELSKDCQEHHLEYAKNSFAQEANQLRGRIGLLVGSIEKVGIFPLGIVTYFQLVQLYDKKVPIFSGHETTIVIGLIVIYFFAIRMFTVSHTLEKITLILDQALSLKRVTKQNNVEGK